jgi:tRNA A37 threonylcarbamoyladenosine biosynthesis protein TsaE
MATNITHLPHFDEHAVASLARFIARHAEAGDCITLTGDLGAGKTHFARSFIRALCGEEVDVGSPTFMISQSYKASVIPAKAGIQIDKELDSRFRGNDNTTTISHYDLYRLEHTDEVEETGLPETLLHHINLIEWSEIAAAYLPPHTLHIVFAFDTSPHYRDIAITGNTLWMTRLQHFHLPNQ